MSENQITSFEEALLCNFEDNLNISEETSHTNLNQLWKGNWELIIRGDLFESFLTNYNNEEIIKGIIEKSNQEEVFCVGIASLFCFVQENFTGPPISMETTEFLMNRPEYDCRKELIIDSEDIDVNVKYSEFLLIAKYVFENSTLRNSNLVNWWYMRYTIIYQHLLDDCAPTLLLKIEDKITELTSWDLNDRLKAKLHLEIAQLYFLYNKVNDSEKNLNKANELLHMELELSGELGRRTKFQQTDIAQIVLRINLKDDIDRPAAKPTTIPEVLKLDDEVRLDKIQYCNAEPQVPILPVTEQTAVLTTVQFMQRAKPKDELLREESEAFLSTLLQQNNAWTIRFVSLLLRSFFECNHKRTIERSLSQCEILITDLNNEDPGAFDRLSTVWSTGMQPRWKTIAHMANLMLNLGLVKASLDMYQNMQMWEEVIVCYTIMELRHKAAEIIQEQLSQNPTVKLWCLLGDATDDISCFEKAWDISEHKSSRAQRHWGQFLFAHRQYLESIPHLQKSLELNSLQNMVWLRLGYAALEIEDWKLAANAYRRYTYLEPGGFEAWNNLAKAYIKLGEKTRAHFALQEALKFSFDNWKIWDNFMIVSAATGHYSDVVKAYHQILDLKEKHLDLEILFMLSKEILTSKNDTEEISANNSRLLAKTRELFGRLTSVFPNESRLWEMYSDLSPTAEIKAQRIYRAYRGLVQGDWSKDPVQCGIVLEMCKRLGEATLEAGKTSNTSTSRLTLKSVVAAAKKQSWEEHAEILNILEQMLQKIIDL